MYNNTGGGQRGPLSDPRHGAARGEAIKGGRGASPLRQVGLVVLVLAGIVGAFLLAGVLLSGGEVVNSTARYIAYGVLGVFALLTVLRMVHRRGSRQSLDQALRSRRPE